MKVRFWGTRGSIAKPGPTTVRYGGNTSCVEVRSPGGTLVILDCGTGGHALGHALLTENKSTRGHILISHTHWDHIQGIPFFAPLFAPEGSWDVYGPRGLGQSLQETLAGQMQNTYFPVTLDDLDAKIRFHDLVEGVFQIGDVRVRTQYLNHTALTLGYRLEAGGVSVVYACDHEPHLRRLATGKGDAGEQDLRHQAFLEGADLVIHDAQYTAGEYDDKIGWGHSTFEYAVEMCRRARVWRLALTHHDPLRDDDAVDGVLATARELVRHANPTLEVFAAAEGMNVQLTAASQPRSSVAHEASPESDLEAPPLSNHGVVLCLGDPDIHALFAEAARAEGIPTLPDEGEAVVASVFLVDDRWGQGKVLDTCRSLRSARANRTTSTPEVPMVVVANAASDVDLAEGKSAGVSEWLVRPISMQYARTRMRAWVLRTECRWVRAPFPENEQQRLAALYRLGVLDTEAEERFDRITRLAAATFEVPIALVSFVDADRQWFKSCIGVDLSEIPRDAAFCAHAILGDDVLVIPDTLQDSRFADNPLVTGKPRIRFYAGCPLKLDDGSAIGTLCLIDTRPREIDADKTRLLKDLATMVRWEFARV